MSDTNQPPPIPPAAELIEVAQQHGRPILDKPRRGETYVQTWWRAVAAAEKALQPWAPEVDDLASRATAAEYFGLWGPEAVHRLRQKGLRADGTPYWPEPGGPGGRPLPGRSPLWTWRRLIAHRAMAPGHTGPGVRTIGPARKREAATNDQPE